MDKYSFKLVKMVYDEKVDVDNLIEEIVCYFGEDEIKKFMLSRPKNKC